MVNQLDPLDQSILEVVKSNLGYEKDDTVYDGPIIGCINTVLTDLSERCGVGTPDFIITGYSEIWSDFVYEPKYASVIGLVWMRTKMIFDAEALASPVNTSYKEICDRIEFQLMSSAEAYI